LKRIYINNQIRAKDVRVIDEKGGQLGVMPLENALTLAREKGLDLIQVTEKLDPPVCKIEDYGKYCYRLQKKEKPQKNKGGEMKGVRLTFGISEHDLGIRAKLAEKFLKEGDAVRIEMKLRGREKAHFDFAREKIQKLIEIIGKSIAVKTEKGLRKEGGNISMIITKG
jgi:translation initiation factor IF-3